MGRLLESDRSDLTRRGRGSLFGKVTTLLDGPFGLHGHLLNPTVELYRPLHLIKTLMEASVADMVNFHISLYPMLSY